jgi:hypothetical protein
VQTGQRGSVAAQLPREKENAWQGHYEIPIDLRLTNNWRKIKQSNANYESKNIPAKVIRIELMKSNRNSEILICF